jgi:oligosaccharyltransferase complex subunit beta
MSPDYIVSAAFPSELGPQSLVELLRRGVNLLVVLSSELTEHWRDFAREFDIDFDERGHRLIDHYAFDSKLDDGSHTTVIVPLINVKAPFISRETQGGPPILYRGTTHEVGRLPLLSEVLTAPATSYGYDISLSDPSDAPVDDVFASASGAGLISAFQAKNNARVAFVGSTDLFSDEFASAAIHSADGIM